jgi:alpha-1,2-mannosyltransferase
MERRRSADLLAGAKRGLGRMDGVPGWAPWVFVGLAATGVWAYLIGTWGTRSMPITYYVDLQVYRTAGHALYAGTFSYQNWYGIYAHLPFTYPPFGLLAVSPLSLVPKGEVSQLWWIANALALLVVVALSLRQVSTLRGARLGAVSALVAGLSLWFLEPVNANAIFGQINVILILGILLDTTCVRGKWRGVLVGVASAIKLTPLVFIAFFLVQRDRRAAVTSVATFAGATATAWIVLPSGSSWFLRNEILSPGRIGNLAFLGNQSWRGLIARLSWPSQAATALWLVAAVVTLAAAIVLARFLVDEGRMIPALFALALGELLVSPISWTHHWSWLAIAPAVAWSERHRLPALSVALVALLALAVWKPYWRAVHGGWWFLKGNSLTLVGGLVLFGWTWAEWRLAARKTGPRAPITAGPVTVGPGADQRSAVPQLG